MEIHGTMLQFEDFVVIFRDTIVGIQINNNIAEKVRAHIF